MSSAPTADEIAADATWLAQAMDVASGNVRVVRMSADDYRAASFLDDRLFQHPREVHIVPWAAATAGLDGARRDARWIFHIGHVGSTLISRLLGELPGIHSVREPRILRDLAASPERAETYFPNVGALSSRTFAADEIAVVKATSFTNEIAASLVPPGGRALFVYARPDAYLGTCLAGENTMKEVATLSPSRQARMEDRVKLAGPLDSPARHVAAAWACEITALEAAAERLGGKAIHWIEFDAFLAAPAAALSEAAAFLGLAAPDEEVAAIVEGPLMRRYSKAMEYEYSPQLRADLIAEATSAHSADIAGALAMLKTAAQDSPLLARALERCGALNV